jgi:hypothetical protein
LHQLLPRIVIHIPHKHISKESISSLKPAHSNHSIEEQTLNTLTCKTTNKTQMQKRKQMNFWHLWFLMMHNYSVICHHLPSIIFMVSTCIHAHPQKILDIVLSYMTKKWKMYYFLQYFSYVLNFLIKKIFWYVFWSFN